MSKKILVLVHTKLIPELELSPEKINRDTTSWITEYDVITALREKGHLTEILGLDEDLNPLIEALRSKKYNCVFNLLEQFNNETQLESNIVALMELYNQSYTGCNSKGLLIAKDKAMSKKILKFHHIDTPLFFTMPKNTKKKAPKSIVFPQIVKCLYEEASFGIAKASIVNSLEKLQKRIRYIHDQLGQDAIVEEFIEGREVYVAIIGEKNLKALPPMELIFENVDAPEKEIYSSQAKWNEKYRNRNGIKTQAAKFDEAFTQKIFNITKRAYRALGLTGYARIDLRITKEGKIFVLEANPNPNIAMDDDFAKSCKLAGIKYNDLIDSLVK